MTVAPMFAIVATLDDTLAAATRDSLAGHQLHHLTIAPRDLLQAPLVLDSTGATLFGHPLAGVLWRNGNAPAAAWAVPEPDRAYAGHEVRALWAAAMDLPDVFALPNLPAEHWVATAGWTHWRRHLSAVGVPVSSLEHGESRPGATWHPYLNTEEPPAPGPHLAQALVAATGPAAASRCIVSGGEVVSGIPNDTTRRAASWLSYWEAGPMEITLDSHNAILRVEPPKDLPTALARCIAHPLIEAYREHLTRR